MPVTPHSKLLSCQVMWASKVAVTPGWVQGVIHVVAVPSSCGGHTTRSQVMTHFVPVTVLCWQPAIGSGFPLIHSVQSCASPQVVLQAPQTDQQWCVCAANLHSCQTALHCRGGEGVAGVVLLVADYCCTHGYWAVINWPWKTPVCKATYHSLVPSRGMRGRLGLDPHASTAVLHKVPVALPQRITHLS